MVLTVYRGSHCESHSLFSEVSMADSFRSRFKGLLGRHTLSEENGLIIAPCNSVHTVGMRFPIDVIYLNKSGVIIKIVEGLKPYKVSYARGARYTLEVGQGMVAKKNIVVGDQLEWAL